MKIYNYDPITFIYTFSKNADLDPEETKRQGKNVYLLPDFATFLEPLTPQTDKAVVFVEKQWDYIADYRKNYYMVNSSLNVMDITKIGELDDGYALVTKELGELIKLNPNDYVFENDTIREKTDKEKQEDEAQRISHLKCTKRVFVLMLEQLGLDYFEQILPLIEANRQARLEWELCVELERANPLLNQIGKKLGITPEQIDNLFRYANGEITENEFIGE
ncbi:MAG: hypothetical protein II244_01530 [Clostridia bacterium]|nr:hypothetical protein [Clostridia bacterium]